MGIGSPAPLWARASVLVAIGFVGIGLIAFVLHVCGFFTALWSYLVAIGWEAWAALLVVETVIGVLERVGTKRDFPAKLFAIVAATIFVLVAPFLAWKNTRTDLQTRIDELQSSLEGRKPEISCYIEPGSHPFERTLWLKNTGGATASDIAITFFSISYESDKNRLKSMTAHHHDPRFHEMGEDWWKIEALEPDGVTSKLYGHGGPGDVLIDWITLEFFGEREFKYEKRCNYFTQNERTMNVIEFSLSNPGIDVDELTREIDSRLGEVGEGFDYISDHRARRQ